MGIQQIKIEPQHNLRCAHIFSRENQSNSMFPVVLFEMTTLQFPFSFRVFREVPTTYQSPFRPDPLIRLDAGGTPGQIV